MYIQGPYEIDGELDEYDIGADVEILASGAVIARVLGLDNFPCLDEEHDDFHAMHQEVIDTALLFKAAPDLLAAIEPLFCNRHWANYDIDKLDDLIDLTIRCTKQELIDLLAAIKKAKGES